MRGGCLQEVPNIVIDWKHLVLPKQVDREFKDKSDS